MQKFNKKYLSALVVSCIATMAVAQPASSYKVAMSKVDDGEPEVHPTYEQPTYEQPTYEEPEPIQENAAVGCCSNVGGIIASILQAGLFLTGIINDDDGEEDLAKLGDMTKPKLYDGGLQLFPGAIQPNQISSFNPLILSLAPGLLLIPSSVVPSLSLTSLGTSLVLTGSSLISSTLLSGIFGLPSASIKGSEALTSSSLVSSSLPVLSSAPVSIPLGASNLSSSLAPSLAPLSSSLGSIPISLSVLSTVPGLSSLSLSSSGPLLLSNTSILLSLSASMLSSGALSSLSSAPLALSSLLNTLSSLTSLTLSGLSIGSSSVGESLGLTSSVLSVIASSLSSSSSAFAPFSLSSFPLALSNSLSFSSTSSSSISLATLLVPAVFLAGIGGVVSTVGILSSLTVVSSLPGSSFVSSGISIMFVGALSSSFSLLSPSSVPSAISSGVSALVSSSLGISGVPLSASSAVLAVSSVLSSLVPLSLSVPISLSSLAGMSSLVPVTISSGAATLSSFASSSSLISAIPLIGAGLLSASLGIPSSIVSLPLSSLAPVLGSLSSIPSALLNSSALVNSLSGVGLSLSGLSNSSSTLFSIPASLSAPVFVPSSLSSLSSLPLSSVLAPSSILSGSSAAVSALLGTGLLISLSGIPTGISAVSSFVIGLSAVPASLVSSLVGSSAIVSSTLSSVLSFGSAVSLSSVSSSLSFLSSVSQSLASSSAISSSLVSSVPVSISSSGLSSLVPSSVPVVLGSLAGASSLLASSSSLVSSVPSAASLSLASSSLSSSASSSSLISGPSAVIGVVDLASSSLSTVISAPVLLPSSVGSSLSSSSALSSSIPASISASLSSSSSAASSLIPLSSVALSPLSSIGPVSSSIGSSAPFTSSAAAISSLGSTTSSVPVGSGLSSVSSGLPSSAPSSLSLSGPVSMASSYAPIISIGGGAISWRLSYPSLSVWKYGFHKYDYNANYDDFEFRNLVTFGDSLSDTGSFGRGSVYMADGNPYVLYNSYLSLALTGKVVTPATHCGYCGTNYAVSGAVLRNDVLDPMSWIIPRDSLKDQVGRYLDRSGGVANKDDAYILWGGGNDVTADIQYALLNPFAWGTILSGAGPDQPYLNDKADIPGVLAQKLIDHGAEGPILVLNLPSSALTSFSGVLLESTMDTGVLTSDTIFDVFNIGGWLMKAQDDFLRNPANRVGDLSAGKGIEYFRENNINAIQHRYPFIPRMLVEMYFDSVFNAQNNVVGWFNQAANNRVKQVTGGNVVQLDIDGLFKEVIDNPLSYGIDEILVPECTIGKVAPACDEGDDYYHGNDGRRYMYTDWHHPSALMHRIIAEYAIATLNAPAYITGLSRSLETGAKARQDYLLSELNRINARAYEGQGQSYIFGGFSGGYSKQSRSLNNHAIVYNGLNIGYGFRPSEGLDFGVMGSLAIGKMKPHRTLKYDQQDFAITGFTQYTAGPWWINGLLTAGTTKFDSIERSIPLGDHTRVENSETDGNTFGGRIETGYEFALGNASTWVLAPMLAYTKYRYEVDAFEEDGLSSTAMRFNKQKRDQEYITAGVRISDDCPDDSAFMRASVDLTVNRNLNEDKNSKKNKLIGEGGLKRYNTTFSREADRLVKDNSTWFEIKPTVQFKLDRNSRVTTSVNYTIDKNKSKSKNLSYSVGYRYEF